MNTNRPISWSTYVLPWIALLALSCQPGTADRCGSGFEWSKADNTCWPIGDDEGGDSDTQEIGDGGVDTDEGDGGAIPEGMGESCFNHDDCDKPPATYCLKDMGAAEGYCTIEDCTTAPDNCPADYACCDFVIDGIPNFCADPETLATLNENGMCENGS